MIAGRVDAQAKVNLLLRILAREQSGYHSLETIFLRLELCDGVHVRATDRGRTIDCGGPAWPSTGVGRPEENLAYRAAAAYSEAAGWPAGFAIEIDKHIPVGGGLGGGSADAGAVLRVLETLSPRPLGRTILTLAAALGADVPFLTSTEAMALGWSRGERLFPLVALPARPVAIVIPTFAVPTRSAYEWLAATRHRYVPQPWTFAPADLASWHGAARIAANDFEPVVDARHPEIGRSIDALRESGASIAMLSGSGSTVFGVFDADPDAARLARATGMTVTVTRTAVAVAVVSRTG